jgi:hypothetical protein
MTGKPTGSGPTAMFRTITAALAAATLGCGSSGDSTSAPKSSGPAPVASVSVDPPTSSLIVGATQSFTATTKDASGNTLTGRTVTWSSSDPSIASVTSGGVAAAVAPGTATITATSESKTGSAAVTVSAAVATVSLTLSYSIVTAGQSVDVQAVPRDAAGAALANRAVTLSSSDLTIATVTPDGFLSTLAAGTVSITAAVEGKTASKQLVVQPPPAADANLHVEFSPLVYPASGGKGLNIILDGRAGTTAATIAVGSVNRAYQRLGQSTRYVVTLSNAELTPQCSVNTGALPACSVGNTTVTTDGSSQTVFALVAQSPPGTAAATVTSLSATAQRSAYTVNIRQDDFDATKVSQQFFQVMPDVFDYLVLNNTAFVPGGSVFFITARNRIAGLGMGIYDFSATYGATATGKLRGFVNYTTNAPVDLAQQVLTHEMGHAFCCFIKNTPLSSGSPHWPLSTAAFGIMGGNGNPGSNAGYMKLTPLGNGTYRVDAQSPYSGFTNLDLYLFGLADSSQVEPQIVFADQTQKATVGAILGGATTTTAIRDIVTANGLRPLEYTGTPITYRDVLVVVSRGRLLTPQEMAFYDVAAQRGEATSSFDGKYLTPFNVNTRGRGILVTKLP